MVGALAAGSAIAMAVSCSTGDAADRNRRTSDVYVAVLDAVLEAEPSAIERAVLEAARRSSTSTSPTSAGSSATSADATSAAGDGRGGDPEKPDKNGAKDGKERLPLVFVSPLEEGRPFALEVQAEVIERLEERASVRFVDTQQQAVDAKVEDEPALDGGVLLRLGRVPAQGDEIQVAAERYQRTDDWTAMRFLVRSHDAGWAATLIDRQPRPADD
jgi:hypothetical protein